MSRPIAYEGTEPYIFISYAHKDSDRVLPIISALQEQGFRVWYDAGIEAGSEWPEYIAEHLESCKVFLALLSQAALDSVNCRQEINFAIEERKDTLIVYLEELRLSAGMRMRLGVLQALYACRHSSPESFLEELCRSRVLAACRGSIVATTATESKPALQPESRLEPPPKLLPKSPTIEPVPTEPVPSTRTPDLDAIGALFEYEYLKDGGIRIHELLDKTLTTVDIPWGVTDIGESAFCGCKSLTSITIPNSVTSIGDYAFDGCEKLTSVTIPNSVTSIGNGAFKECKSLTSVTIPNSVTSIGDSAFDGCENLTSVTIPNSVTHIGNETFAWCYCMTSIFIPSSVTNIGDGAFLLCENLTIYGKRGSTAERYAIENEIPFTPI